MKFQGTCLQFPHLWWWHQCLTVTKRCPMSYRDWFQLLTMLSHQSVLFCTSQIRPLRPSGNVDPIMKLSHWLFLKACDVRFCCNLVLRRILTSFRHQVNRWISKLSRRRILGLMLTVNVVCRIQEVETRSVSVVMHIFLNLSQSAQCHCARM